MRHRSHIAGLVMVLWIAALVGSAPMGGAAVAARHQARSWLPYCRRLPPDRNGALRAHPACRVSTTGDRPHTARSPA
jgi:hypothetical protein